MGRISFLVTKLYRGICDINFLWNSFFYTEIEIKLFCTLLCCQDDCDEVVFYIVARSNLYILGTVLVKSI